MSEVNIFILLFQFKIKPMEHEVILGIVNEHHHWTLVVNKIIAFTIFIKSVL